MSVILRGNGRPALYYALCSLWSLRTSLSSPCIPAVGGVSVLTNGFAVILQIYFFPCENNIHCHEVHCYCILPKYAFRSSEFVLPFMKFPLIISTLLLQCPFIIADIATISCCVPHNKQVFYQLLVRQEWTPATFSPHYLPWHITCLLIY